MRVIGVLAVSVFTCAASPAFAADEDVGFGHMLTLVQQFVRIAAQDDPSASVKAVEELLSGRNSEANRAFAGLFDEATAGMPGEHRDKIASIGQDLAGIMRREVRAPAPLAGPSVDRALQARKDLTSMGLRYYDETQFQEAVKRGDKLAIALFVAGEGIDPAVIARNLPATR